MMLLLSRQFKNCLKNWRRRGWETTITAHKLQLPSSCVLELKAATRYRHLLVGNINHILLVIEMSYYFYFEVFQLLWCVWQNRNCIWTTVWAFLKTVFTNSTTLWIISKNLSLALNSSSMSQKSVFMSMNTSVLSGFQVIVLLIMNNAVKILVTLSVYQWRGSVHFLCETDDKQPSKCLVIWSYII